MCVKDQRMHFSASHFLKAGSEVENLHGHNYSLKIKLTGPLNNDGMVFDFRKVKEKALKICKLLDHKVLLPSNSGTINIIKSNGFLEVNVDEKRYVFPEEDCVIIPMKATTTELLAEYIHENLDFPEDLKVKICVSESEGSTGCFKK
ncbi:MAG: 6-pyruvoyl tetrahydropterin synthase family protein [Candidatus Sifarchaeia archaeon]